MKKKSNYVSAVKLQNEQIEQKHLELKIMSRRRTNCPVIMPLLPWNSRTISDILSF